MQNKKKCSKNEKKNKNPTIHELDFKKFCDLTILCELYKN